MPNVMQNLKGFEVALRLILFGMRSLEDAYESWRGRVFGGVEELDSDAEHFHQTRLQEWLDGFKSFNEEIKTQCLDNNPAILSDLQEIRDGYERITSILDNWESPYLSPNPTFRKLTISAKEEAKIDEIVNRR